MPISVRNFLITFLLSLAIFGAFAYLLSNFVVDSLRPKLGGDITSNTGEVGTDDEGNPINPGGDTIKGSSFNILLIGTDYQPHILNDYNPQIAAMYPRFGRISLDPESEQGFDSMTYRRISPDTIIIVRVNKEMGQFTFTALPTNMQVYSGGVATALGDLYQDEGLDFFLDMVRAITGLPIDYYVIADVMGLSKAIDFVDGITYTVPVDMNYSDPEQDLFISLKAGAQKLNGDKALQLLRFNNYTSGTNSRLKTGISFLRAIASKMTNIVYLTHITTKYEQISPHFITNFALSDLTKNLDLIFSYPNFRSFEITYPGSYSEIEGETYFIPNITQAIKNFSSYR